MAARYDCDVVVVGAGPGGSMAAKYAAEGGAKTILIEKKAEIGAPLRCAEGVSKKWLAELGIKPRGGMVTELIHYFNALYLMGRQPNVVCRSLHREYDVPAEKLLEQYPIYFRIFGVEEDVSVPFLRDYLDRHAENGLLHEESLINFARITWRPDEA